jgi:DNA replication protein DnaC
MTTIDAQGTQDEDAVARLLASFEAREIKSAERLASFPKTQPCPTCNAASEIDPSSIWDSDTGAPRSPRYICQPCKQKRDQAHATARNQLALKRAEIPASVWHATLENFRTDRPNINTAKGYSSPEQFLAAAQRLRRAEIRNLFLAGQVGIGKGHLAAALANAAIARGRTVCWRECAKLFSEYHRAYATDTTQQTLAPLIRSHLLILDEVCLRDLPADGEEILFAVFDRRNEERRPSIILGNQNAHETRKWLGERIADRLREGGHEFCFGAWQSMRGQSTDPEQTAFTF